MRLRHQSYFLPVEKKKESSLSCVLVTEGFPNDSRQPGVLTTERSPYLHFSLSILVYCTLGSVHPLRCSQTVLSSRSNPHSWGLCWQIVSSPLGLKLFSLKWKVAGYFQRLLGSSFGFSELWVVPVFSHPPPAARLRGLTLDTPTSLQLDCNSQSPGLALYWGGFHGLDSWFYAEELNNDKS